MSILTTIFNNKFTKESYIYFTVIYISTLLIERCFKNMDVDDINTTFNGEEVKTELNDFNMEFDSDVLYNNKELYPISVVNSKPDKNDKLDNDDIETKNMNGVNGVLDNKCLDGSNDDLDNKCLDGSNRPSTLQSGLSEILKSATKKTNLRQIYSVKKLILNFPRSCKKRIISTFTACDHQVIYIFIFLL